MSAPRKADLIRALQYVLRAELQMTEAVRTGDILEVERRAAMMKPSLDQARALLITGEFPEDAFYWESELAAERRAEALEIERREDDAFQERMRARRAAVEAGAGAR